MAKELSMKGLVLGFGITWAVWMLFAGWAAIFGWGTSVVMIMSSLYIGFAPTFLGGIIGGVWGFVDGAIAGLITVAIYNRFA